LARSGDAQQNPCEGKLSTKFGFLLEGRGMEGGPGPAPGAPADFTNKAGPRSGRARGRDRGEIRGQQGGGLPCEAKTRGGPGGAPPWPPEQARPHAFPGRGHQNPGLLAKPKQKPRCAAGGRPSRGQNSTVNPPHFQKDELPPLGAGGHQKPGFGDGAEGLFETRRVTGVLIGNSRATGRARISVGPRFCNKKKKLLEQLGAARGKSGPMLGPLCPPALAFWGHPGFCKPGVIAEAQHSKAFLR